VANVYISLGSNLGNKQSNLDKAIDQLQQRAGVVRQKSTIYQTEPWGYASFNNFLNQVVHVTTDHTPSQLLTILLKIESDLGRQRVSEGLQDRVIDLDILFFDDQVISSDKLKIPHPRLHERLFMLEPMAEIAPNFIHPQFKQTVDVLTQVLKKKVDNK
jgi:2-amino-4-hydroxy-6-hydroxymethyldihydropteridine diphosphokinase